MRILNWQRVNFEGDLVFLFERNTWDDDSNEDEEDSSSADSDQEETVRSRRLPARR